MSPVVVTRCGEMGHPYSMRDPRGLRTTIWERDATCPKCRKIGHPPGHVPG